MRTRGFTLIELLVVVAIIATLAGLGSVGMSLASKRKALVRTQALMGQLTADLTSFKTVNGWYPEETKPGLPSTGETWDQAFGSTPGPATSANWTAAAACLIHQLNLMGATYKDLDDAWKMPLRYRPAKYHPFQGTGTGVDNETPPGKDSYQLWSCGPDKLDQQGQADDLTSWPK
jgi:prepilin-type N-terminal cleavage/methylation domain-containing protein